MEKIRVASVQMEHHDQDKEYNLSVIEDFSRRAAAEGCRAVAFPEHCISGYMCMAPLNESEMVALADEIPAGKTVATLKRIAAENKINVLAGTLEIDNTEGGNLYNTYVIVSPEGRVERYRKLHPFVSEYMKPGREYLLWDMAGWRAGSLICYDSNLWENWRVLQIRGAQIVFCPHQTGGFDIPCAGMGKIDVELWKNRDKDPEAIRKELEGPKGYSWITKWLPSRAYDAGAFVVFSNGVGIDGPDEVRTGCAMIIDPHGIILDSTTAAGDDMVVAELDPAGLELNLGKAHFRARRPELYGEISQGKDADTRKMRTAIRSELGAEMTDIRK